jgi:hypothetical protein
MKRKPSQYSREHDSPCPDIGLLHSLRLAFVYMHLGSFKRRTKLTFSGAYGFGLAYVYGALWLMPFIQDTRSLFEQTEDGRGG